MRIPLLGTSKTEWTDIYLWYSRGIFLSTSPFKGILIKCFLVTLSYIKIAKGNITLDRISIPISWASLKKCVKSDRFIQNVKTVHLDLYTVFSFYILMLQRTVLREVHFSRKVSEFALIDESTLPVNKDAVEKRCQQMFKCCV